MTAELASPIQERNVTVHQHDVAANRCDVMATQVDVMASPSRAGSQATSDASYVMDEELCECTYVSISDLIAVRTQYMSKYHENCNPLCHSCRSTLYKKN